MLANHCQHRFETVSLAGRCGPRAPCRLRPPQRSGRCCWSGSRRSRGGGRSRRSGCGGRGSGLGRRSRCWIDGSDRGRFLRGLSGGCWCSSGRRRRRLGRLGRPVRLPGPRGTTAHGQREQQRRTHETDSNTRHGNTSGNVTGAAPAPCPTHHRSGNDRQCFFISRRAQQTQLLPSALRDSQTRRIILVLPSHAAQT